MLYRFHNTDMSQYWLSFILACQSRGYGHTECWWSGYWHVCQGTGLISYLIWCKSILLWEVKWLCTSSYHCPFQTAASHNEPETRGIRKWLLNHQENREKRHDLSEWKKSATHSLHKGSSRRPSIWRPHGGVPWIQILGHFCWKPTAIIDSTS